ncbi:MAG: LUD domain-containing protein [Silvibacterium sp.]
MLETNDAARAAILGHIRTANSSVDGAMCSVEYKAIERTYQQSASMGRVAILKKFAERLHEYDAQVYEATSATLRATIDEVFAGHDQKSAIVANGFRQECLPEALNWQAEADADIAAMNRTEGAIVTCEVAIAHTGTIVLKDARRLTLLPDRLLCVVREDQVVETVPEAIAHLQPFASEALTFISGPSATADIEMTRIRGVHGPRFLDVILVKD